MLLSPLSVSGLSRAGRGSGPHDVRAGIEVVATMILSHQWPVEGVASARCACGVQFGRPPGGNVFLNKFICFIGEEAKTENFIKYFLWEQNRVVQNPYNI